MTILLLLLMVLGQTGVPALQELPAGWRLDPKTQSLVHEATNSVFPATHEGMQRGEAFTYDRLGKNVAVNYARPRHELWVTVYIYPRSYGEVPEPRDHFSEVLREVEAKFPEAKREHAVERPVPVGSRDWPGFVAFYRYVEHERPAGTFVFLVPVEGDRFVKVRASRVIEAGDQDLDDALAAALALLRLIRIDR